MSKMCLATNFQKLPSERHSAPIVPLTPDFGDLKLRDLPKLRFFKRIVTNSNFKKSVMTSFQLRHHYCVTKNRHQTRAPPNQNFWLRQWTVHAHRLCAGNEFMR